MYEFLLLLSGWIMGFLTGHVWTEMMREKKTQHKRKKR